MRSSGAIALPFVAVLAALAAGAPPAAAQDQRARLEPHAPRRPAAELRFGVVLERARAGETVTIYVSAHDADGHPTDAAITVDADVGVLGPLTRVTEGRYAATLAIPEVLPSHHSILLLARSAALSAETTLPVVPGAAATMQLDGPAVIVADGARRAQLVVTLADAYGNPADDPLRATARRGTPGPAERIGPGRWTLEYQPRRTLADAVEVLSLEAGPLRREHALRLTSRRSWAAAAAWAGIARGAGRSAPAFGVGLSGWRRLQAGQLGLGLELAWWSADEEDAVDLPGGAATLRGARGFLPVTASAAWAVPLGRGLVASLSAGAGAARISTSERLPGQPEVVEVGWAAAASGGVGLALRAWRGEPFVEVRALWVGDPGLETLAGSSRPLLVLAGYRFDGR